MAFPHAVINGCSRILLVSDHENEQPPLKTDEQENATKNHEHNQQFSTVVDSEAFFEGKMAEIDKEVTYRFHVYLQIFFCKFRFFRPIDSTIFATAIKGAL